MPTTAAWLVALGAAAVAVAFGALALVLRKPVTKASGARDEPEEVRRLRDAVAFATLDVETLSARLLETATLACGAEAAGIGLRLHGGRSHVDALGLSGSELAWLSSLLQAENETAMIMRYPTDGSDSTEDRIETALVAPCRNPDGDHAGNVAALWRHDLGGLADERLDVLVGLAEAAAGAIESAVRFQEVSVLSVLDPMTDLFNRRYFFGKLADEVERARREQHPLAVLVVEIDDFQALADRIGHPQRDAVLAQVSDRVRAISRDSDIACRLEDDELAVILPVAGSTEADELLALLRGQLGAISEGLTSSAGVAELEPDDSAGSLYERAEQALSAAKKARRGRSVAAA
jgi:diguanylate cyclase (GGDEF)-like protein